MHEDRREEDPVRRLRQVYERARKQGQARADRLVRVVQRAHGWQRGQLHVLDH